METTATQPSRRSSTIIWLALLLIAAIAWTIVVLQSQAMDGMDQGMAAMAPEPVSALFFLPLWIAMMVAMMFPAIAPVVSLFAAIGRKRHDMGQRAAPAWLFIAGYLIVWSLFGVGVYLLSLLVPALSMAATGLRADSPAVAAAVFVLAGLYQLSPLKQVCLRHCRSPLGVIVHGWHEGPAGAVRMGIAHGAYCLGCCWGLMLVLFAVGLMNLTWMVILTIVIFAEKIIPAGELVGKLTAVALILFGIGTLLL